MGGDAVAHKQVGRADTCGILTDGKQTGRLNPDPPFIERNGNCRGLVNLSGGWATRTALSSTWVDADPTGMDLGSHLEADHVVPYLEALHADATVLLSS
jgi:hypothetical protein